MAAPKILVVDDEPTVREVVAQYLTRDGYEVHTLDRGDGLMAAVAAFHPDLVVLDIMLPGASGLDFLRHSSTDRPPVILLTARVEESDRVLGLELGADDYVTKPFSPREIVARVKAILRRLDGPAAPAAPAITEIGGVEVDLGRREARRHGAPIALATREFDLLSYLADHRGLALSRRQLLDGVWGDGWVGDERTVDVHVRQLRKKLGDDLPLDTVWGVGYRLG